MGGIAYHTGADGVDLDVEPAEPPIGFDLHQQGILAAVPQSARAPVAVLDELQAQQQYQKLSPDLFSWTLLRLIDVFDYAHPRE